jgi:hypothetical protein
MSHSILTLVAVKIFEKTFFFFVIDFAAKKAGAFGKTLYFLRNLRMGPKS